MPGPSAQTGGQRLWTELTARTTNIPDIEVRAVDCLAVCENAVVVAFAAPGKWTYVVGGANAAGAASAAGEAEAEAGDADDVIAVASAIGASAHGIPAMKDRPPFFRAGVIARVPPLPETANTERAGTGV